jgi:hypothetical protein
MRSEIDELSDVPPISDLYELSEDAVHNEALRVLDELTEFLTVLLPRMAAAEADRPAASGDAGASTLRQFRQATTRLLSLLNTVDSSDGPPEFRRDEFWRIIGPWPEPGVDFDLVDGQIRWLLAWSIGLRWTDVARHTLRLPNECHQTGPDDAHRSIEVTRQWMLQSSVRERRLHDAMGDVLPAIADCDPKFASSMLDVEAWRQRILARSLSHEVRQREPTASSATSCMALFTR